MREVGGFRLLRELGRGGFGSVHLAEHSEGRTAAVKLLHVASGTDPGFRQMFAREVEAARRVTPFCIAEVLDADPHAEQPWIATEYIDGPTLAEQIREHGPRHGSDLQRLAVSTATALTAIHRAGVVHRDLKPENIMLAADGPRVIDFGIAKAFEETGAITASAMIGTLQYMSPEQLEGSATLTTAVDVFAWGSVMVYAASAQHAFRGPSQSVILKKILVDEPDCSQVPEELREVVQRCLSKNPQERPSAHEILDELLGYGTSTDAETALNRGSTAATNFQGPDGTRLNPTLRETRQGQPPAPPEEPAPGPAPSEPRAAPPEPRSSAPAPAPEPQSSPPPRPSREAAETVPPMEFAGRLHRSLDELAESMQYSWPEAVQVFMDPQERAALGAWIAQDLHDTRPDRRAFRVEPDNPDVAVARLVSQVRPDLPPVYQGELATHTDLRNWAEDTGIRTRVERVLPLGALEILTDHHCTEALHPCAPDEPCAVYRDLARTVRAAGATAEEVLAPYRRVVDSSRIMERSGEESDAVADCSEFIVAVFHADELVQGVNDERKALPQAWRHCVPRAESRATTVGERAGRAVAVLDINGAVEQAVEQEKQASSHELRLREFIDYHNRFSTSSRAARVVGYIAGGFVLFQMTIVGLVNLDWARFWWGIPLAGLAFYAPFVFVGAVHKEPEGMIDPLPGGDDERKMAQANKNLAATSSTLHELAQLRRELSSAVGPGD